MQPRIFILAITFLLTTQVSYAQTVTEKIIPKKTEFIDNTGIDEIIEDDFYESLQTDSKNYFWTINLKKGPYNTKKEAKKEGINLKNFIRKSKDIYKQKEITFLNENNLDDDKKKTQPFSWTVNFRIGPYKTKLKALEIAEKLNTIQKTPENIILTREENKSSRPQNIDKSLQKYQASKDLNKIRGKIFLTNQLISNKTPPLKKTIQTTNAPQDSLEVTLQHKDKTDNNKGFVLVTTSNKSLNVRQKPSSSSRVMASLLKGSKVPFITNNNPIKGNSTWFKVEYSKGMYGWVHSKYSKIIKQPLNIKTAQSNFLIKTDNEKVSSKIKQLTASKTLDDSNGIINFLRKKVIEITIDKTQAIKSRNEARAILEKKIISTSIEIKNLKKSTASLRKELEKSKSEKSAVTLATKQANSKIQADILASNKRYDDLAAKKSLETKIFKTTTASLRKELKKVKSEKSAVILATKQANIKIQADILASNKRYDDLAAKKSLETKIFKTTTASLRKELKKVKSEKSAVILATKQANIKIQADILASNKRYDGLAAKKSLETKAFKTTTASLRKELEKVKSEKSAVILATKQANIKFKRTSWPVIKGMMVWLQKNR